MEQRPQPVPPEPHRLMRDVDTALVQMTSVEVLKYLSGLRIRGGDETATLRSRPSSSVNAPQPAMIRNHSNQTLQNRGRPHMTLPLNPYFF